MERTLRDVANFFGVPISILTGEAEEEQNTAVVHGGGFEGVPLRLIPVYESVSAGFGTLARNEVIAHVPCVIQSYEEARETIGIKVQGDSMYPKIEDGDTIVVHKQTSVDSGSIAVVMVDGEEGLVKRVEYGAEWIHLISINPTYPVIKFTGKDVLRVRVVGKVTKIIKEV